MRRRSKLRRRYGHMHDGQQFHVRIRNAAGEIVGQWHDRAGAALNAPTDVALGLAGHYPFGSVIEIREWVKGKVLAYKFQVGRFAGLPSVERIRRKA